MNLTRRRFMGDTVALAAALATAGWLTPSQAQAAAWNRAAFEAKTLEELLALLGGGEAVASTAMDISAPDIAENGAVVPLVVSSILPDTQSIAILVEKNPNVLAAVFTFPKGTFPEIQTRVKMAQTCNIYALGKAGGKNFYAAKEIKVTLGGCGG
jgi:sulfur-oxidizing protein SoxY